MSGYEKATLRISYPVETLNGFPFAGGEDE